RRHTRWPRDWSSDVCSSDLDVALAWLEALGRVALEARDLALIVRELLLEVLDVGAHLALVDPSALGQVVDAIGDHLAELLDLERSEERRVGKECRWRWRR